MRTNEQSAQQRFDESVQREIRRLIAKGREQSMEPPPWTDPEIQPTAFTYLTTIILESMEWPTEPCESMEFRDGLPPQQSRRNPYCCEMCDELDAQLSRDDLW